MLVCIRTTWQNLGTKQNENTIYVRIPYINDVQSRKVRTELRRISVAKVIPIFISPPPLATQLKVKPKLPCIKNCLCNNKSCFIKNMVYLITCNKCEDTYIGESQCTFRRRIHQHLSEIDSNVYQHFFLKHKTSTSINFIITEILQRNFSDVYERKAAEKKFITKYKPKINIMLSA